MADFRLGRLKFNWRGDWAGSTAYVIDDIVKFGANSYVCTTNHTSSSSESSFYSTDLSNWSLHTEGIVNKGEFVADTFYKVNDVIKYGNTQYRVVTGFSTSGFTTSNVVEYLAGFQYEDTWNSGTQYQPGDVVTYGGYSYIATSIHLNKPPAYNLSSDWDILTTGFTAVGTYSTTLDYRQGDVVQYGGYSYVAISTSINVDPTNPGSWSLVVKGVNWVGSWSSTTEYKLGDSVSKDSNSYISVASTNLNQDPTTDTIGAYWNSLAEGAETNVLTTQGDLVYRSGSGPARLGIGVDGQVLTVNSSGVPSWEDNNVTHPVYYVTEEGNDSNDGRNIQRSFATIRHACGIATGPATIYVKAGVYNETLPIVVPEEVSVVGDNIRTTKIRPASGDSTIQILTLVSAASTVSYGTTITNGIGTKVARILYSDYAEKVIKIDYISGGAWTTSDTWNDPGGSIISIAAVETRANNQATMFQLSNKTMLKDLVMEGLVGFTTAGIVTTLTGSISGTTLTGTNLTPDLVGTTVTGAGVSGGTSIVNFTNSTTMEVSIDQTVPSTALTYTASPDDLNNAIVKGVAVELNPSSPITKSPYVSQCSAFSGIGGGGCGAIVDGKVHRQFLDSGPTPSNKSIVFDSFTNVHDNGVGFWVTNNGAAEFVSCFTYYAHISYSATRGGRIRSLAGNSSWGNYGLVSSGFNTEEEFLTGTVDGLIVQYTNSSIVGPGFTVNEKIVGSSSGAVGKITSVQGTDIYYELVSAGPAGVGTGFAIAETITGQTSGTTAGLASNTDANRGQAGFTIVLSGISSSLIPGGSIEFVTGSGNGGVNNVQISGADPFTYVIQTVSYSGPTGLGTIYVNRAQLASTGAAHTGGTTRITQYPTANASTTLSSGISNSDTTINVVSGTGFTLNGFALIGDELLKINNILSSTQFSVTRNADGSGPAATYSSGTPVVALGTSSILSSTELKRDITAGLSTVRVTNTLGFSTNSYYKIDNEFLKVTDTARDVLGQTIIILAEEKGNQCFDGQNVKVRYLYSQARFTGHDFLQIGTGGTATTNWPSVPIVDPIPSREIVEKFPGRVFYVSTDSNGNFRVGRYFRVNQATGAATLNASAFDLSGLTSLRLGSIGAQLGAQINEFSTDPTLSQNSNEKVSTQAAVKAYVDTTVATEVVSQAAQTLSDSKEYTELYSYFVSQST